MIHININEALNELELNGGNIIYETNDYIAVLRKVSDSKYGFVYLNNSERAPTFESYSKKECIEKAIKFVRNNGKNTEVYWTCQSIGFLQKPSDLIRHERKTRLRR